jgi:hypothetical protein
MKAFSFVNRHDSFYDTIASKSIYIERFRGLSARSIKESSMAKKTAARFFMALDTKPASWGKKDHRLC